MQQDQTLGTDEIIISPAVEVDTEIIENVPSLEAKPTQDELPEVEEIKEPTVEEEKARKVQEEAKKLKEKDDNDRRSEQGKNAIFQKALNTISDLNNPETVIDAIANLASDEKNYYSLRPHIQRAFPQFKDLSHSDFVSQVKNLDNDQKIQVEKVQSKIEQKENTQLEIAKARQQTKIGIKIPEFGQQFSTNPQKAQYEYESALTIATQKANYLISINQDVNVEVFDTLVMESLAILNPDYKSTIANNQNLKNVLIDSQKTAPSSKITLSANDMSLYSQLNNDAEYIRRYPEAKTRHSFIMSVINPN